VVELGVTVRVTAAARVALAAARVAAQVRCQEAKVAGRVAMAAVVEGVGAAKAAVDS